nr:LacI family DNA-binding transcriptional regulator [uncultured Cohaesibacter sp.]
MAIRQVTMQDVADAAGVSRMTVSRALRENSIVNAKTRKRILDVVQELGYVPDQAAGSLSSRKSGFVSVLIPSLDNPHFARTVQILNEELSVAGMQVLLGHTGYSAEKEEELVESFLRRRPEAMLLSCDGHTEKSRSLLEKSGIPVIELWESPHEPIQHVVGFSNFEAAQTLTRSLLDLGYSKIAFIGETRPLSSRNAERFRGFQSALKQAGLSSDRHIYQGARPFNIASGVACCKKVMDEFPDTDCIFCASDPAAYGVLTALQEMGLSVPEDIGVAGFGDFDIAHYCRPSLTTIGVDPNSLARTAIDLLKRVLNISADADSYPDKHEIIEVEPSLRLRGSTRQQG